MAIRDLATLSGIFDAVLRVGARSIPGLEWRVPDTAETRDAALRMTTSDGRRRAELLATMNDVRLGAVQKIGQIEFGDVSRYSPRWRWDDSTRVDVFGSEPETGLPPRRRIVTAKFTDSGEPLDIAGAE